MENQMDRNTAKDKLQILLVEFQAYIAGANRKDISEETIRTWINSFLGIFNWDVRDTSEVLQEKTLSTEQKNKLIDINSTHSRPDYTLVNGQNIKAFIDTKDLDIDIFTDSDTAFQVRSYGWSANVPCSFATNFEQLVIFDCRFKPNISQNADVGSIKIHISEYLDKFDIIFDHLNKDCVKSNRLEEIYALASVKGNNKLDTNFNIMLTEFRVRLAQNLLTNNPQLAENIVSLNYYVQIILDRIIFIRVCESRGIEILERLKSFKSNDFWNSFKNCCYVEFYDHYDGAMFERDLTFNSLVLDNEIFDTFIDSLYYPYPYKFDVIPIKVIAQIYEDFLSKQLVVSNNIISEQLKSEYVKEKGAITTPQYIVEEICKSTITFDDNVTIDDILNLKILDPACGSGVFLVSCFDLLCDKVIDLYKNKMIPSKYENWFVENHSGIYLSVDARREIIKNCLFGIDIDESAVEVSKMSLALKIIDNNDLLTLNDIGVFGDKILRQIQKNIKLGNTLVDTNIEILPSLIHAVKPFNFELGFDEVFSMKGGFDYIVGNPPYVETKHYKVASPKMHEYIKNRYLAFKGKADLSVIFIEKCLDILNKKGKMGFIVQKRFFKTEYGQGIRKIISKDKLLNRVIDFKTDKLFNKRITYVAIMIISKESNESIDYQFIPFEPLQIKTYFEKSSALSSVPIIPLSSNLFSDDIWAFESHKILSLIESLKSEHGTMNDFQGLQIKDGIQSLWKKIYHITDCNVTNGIVTGLNGFKNYVEIELTVARPLIYNNLFYCFKELSPNAYSLFPYRQNNKTPISMSEMEMEFPRAYQYLKNMEQTIKATVECYKKDDYWHKFTREHNHDTFMTNKIILPMTAKDTIGTVSIDRGLYMDNANVWFITIADADNDLLKSVCAVINSTVFSVLAKSKANPQSGGYYKLNKQFLLPVPFPSEKLKSSPDFINSLVALSDEIIQLQEKYLTATPNVKEIIGGVLSTKWNEIDNICYKLYGLTEPQKALIIDEGRTVSRIELLREVI